MLQVLTLSKIFHVPAHMIWQTLIGTHVLERHGIFSPDLLDHKEPTTFFSLDPETLASDVTDANPALAEEIAHLVDHPARPFLICNLAMFVRSEGASSSSLGQCSQRHVHWHYRPSEGTDANGLNVGGGGVTSFGFAATFKAQSGQDFTLAQERQWSLADAIGTSSLSRIGTTSSRASTPQHLSRTTAPTTKPRAYSWPAVKRSPGTRIEVDYQIPPLFGYQP